MSLLSHALPHIARGFRALAGSIVFAAAFALIGCSASPHEDVYSLASERSRIIAPALIAPGMGTEYAFTIESVPVIEIACAVTGATARYSIDGGEYQAYGEPFALSVADPKIDQTINLTAYTTHPDYLPSEPVTQVYRFVATTVPAPAITPTAAGSEYAFTIAIVPSIGIACSLSGATTQYSIDGGEYRTYDGPFALSVADPKVGQTITVTAYSTHPDYIASPTVTRVYRFVPTTAPAPVIASSKVPNSYHYYYHYDSLPTITATCALPSATIRYSLNGGATYETYSGPFALPVTAGSASIETYTLTMYASAEGYVDSAVSSETYRFARNGAIVTIAGTGGTSGFADGEPASARFNLPYGVVVDADTNVYVVDFMNNRVRRISPDGIVSTFAGNGATGFSGDGGPATDASLSSPHSFALDEANGILYVSCADSLTACVRAIDLQTKKISTFAGTPGFTAVISPPSGSARLSASFRAVLGIALKAPSSLVAIDPGFSAIFGIDDTVSLVAGQPGMAGDSALGDLALACKFSVPYAVGFTMDGDLLVLDSKGIDGRLYEFHDDKVFSYYSALSAPRALSVTDSGIYVAESGLHRILCIDTLGGMNPVAGTGIAGYSGDGGLASAATLNEPSGVFAVEGDGIYISDTNNHCIRKVILY